MTGIGGVAAAYCESKPADAYLFPSRKGASHISTTQAYRILTNELLGRDDIGTHTMRKAYGYHVYKATKKYIGITEEERRESRKGFAL